MIHHGFPYSIVSLICRGSSFTQRLQIALHMQLTSASPILSALPNHQAIRATAGTPLPNLCTWTRHEQRIYELRPMRYLRTSSRSLHSTCFDIILFTNQPVLWNFLQWIPRLRGPCSRSDLKRSFVCCRFIFYSVGVLTGLKNCDVKK